MEKIKQTDRYNEEDLITDNRDEYEQEIDDGDERRDEAKASGMTNALSSFNLSSGAIIIVVTVLVIAIVMVVIFKPFGGNADSGEGFSIGKFFGKDNSLASDITGGNSTMSYEDSLIQYLEDYTAKNNEDGTYTVTGMQDGQQHIMVYDGSFNMLTETLGDQTTAYEIDPATGETIQTNPITSNNVNTNQQKSEIVEGEDMVKVDKWSYEHSQLGMPLTELNMEYDENDVLVKKSYDDKFIVAYTRLPLRGNSAQVHVNIMETDVELIFNISPEAYLQLEDEGVSMISTRVTEIGGQKMFHNVKFLEWK